MPITLTRDQAERCMREDSRFWVSPSGLKPHRIENGVLQFLYNPTDNEWWNAEEAEYAFNDSVKYTIHSDPNKTYDKLFGKTDMTNETEQKYLTRSEALKAMEEGERVQARVVNIQPGEFWMKKDILLTTARVDVSAWQTFGRYTKFVLVPHPDSPEKFVRDMAEHIDSVNKPRIVLSLEKSYEFSARLTALIQQMDKEGKV